MLKVALTGGIATGKSFVLSCFQRRGVACLDADELAHGVMAAGTEAAHRIAEQFGSDVLDADGAVNRQRLGPIVFADAAARRALEAIVHPAVYRAIAVALRALERLGDTPLAVVDIPLLFETGREREFDAVVATVCSPELQRQRLGARGLTDADIDRRLAAQWPAADKAARATYAIDTNGSQESTATAVDALIATLLADAPG